MNLQTIYVVTGRADDLRKRTIGTFVLQALDVGGFGRIRLRQCECRSGLGGSSTRSRRSEGGREDRGVKGRTGDEGDYKRQCKFRDATYETGGDTKPEVVSDG